MKSTHEIKVEEEEEGMGEEEAGALSAKGELI